MTTSGVLQQRLGRFDHMGGGGPIYKDIVETTGPAPMARGTFFDEKSRPQRPA
jgi:hypothetical protein